MPGDTGERVDIEADRGITAFIRARTGRERHRVGPFLIMFTAGTTTRHLNYAVPDDGADPTAAEIDGLIGIFKRSRLLPRLEFLPSMAPALEARLVARGFAVEERLPLMTCVPATVRSVSPPAGVLLDAPRDDTTLLAMTALQHEIFEDPEPADALSVARLRSALERGGRAVAATDAATRTLVGAAQTVVPGGGATEVVGVAVAPSHRRRGIAAAMVSALARRCFDDGLVTAFLEAAPGADGAYRDAGFLRTSTVVHISLEGESDA